VKHFEGISHIFSCRTNKGSRVWIVDSGATGHICTSLNWFNSYHKILPIPVSLPNGNKVMAELAGNITISDALHLKDVLFYLLSISTLYLFLNLQNQQVIVSHLLMILVTFKIKR